MSTSTPVPSEALEAVAWREFDHTTIDYVLRYGGRCRECADHLGLCPNGLPCDVDDAKTAIRHVLKALNYGIANGFVASPPKPSPDVVAEALREALKPFAKIADMEPNTPDGHSVFVNISRCRDALRVLEALARSPIRGEE